MEGRCTTLRDLCEEQHGAGGDHRRGRQLGSVVSKALIALEFLVKVRRVVTVGALPLRTFLILSSVVRLLAVQRM